MLGGLFIRACSRTFLLLTAVRKRYFRSESGTDHELFRCQVSSVSAVEFPVRMVILFDVVVVF